MTSYLFLNYKNDDEFFLDEYDNNSLTISEIKKYESVSEKINLYKDMIFFTKLLNQHKKNTKIIIINILLISLPLSSCVIVAPNPILKFLS